MKLKFQRAKSEQDFQEIYDYNIDAFSDTPDFNWNMEEIKHEVADGWELYSVKINEEVVAALFYKVENGGLLTKNTAIKMNYQGAGISHQIKEFFEKLAKDKKLKKILHYCRIDNFRMYSLNESHGYKKTTKKLNDGLIVEWMKELK